MADFNIPSGPGRGPKIDAAETVRESAESRVETRDVEGASRIGTDSVDQIAADVAAGRIGRTEAVDRILADVLGSRMVESAPEALRQELETALVTLIEEDPHLRSLTAAIGPYEIE